MITLITCTGGRPEAFALCERWMSRQTLDADMQWIVVDDCDPATPANRGQIILRPQPRWEPGTLTLARNLAAALTMARGDKIIFIEDDDWYGPTYLADMSARLDGVPLAGEIPARYYHVPERRYFEVGNAHHASLCQTGIRGDMVPALLSACQAESKFLDLLLWQKFGKKGRLEVGSGSVGIKGMPGRPGIGVGHRSSGSRWKADPSGEGLRSWIGLDAVAYGV